MEQIGTIVTHVFTSQAELPISGATVTFILQTESGGYTLLGTRVTDQSGDTTPVKIETPDLMKSMSPGMPQAYALVDVWVEHPGFERLEIRNIQVFSGIQSIQEIPMLPLSGSQLALEKQNGFQSLNSGTEEAPVPTERIELTPSPV